MTSRSRVIHSQSRKIVKYVIFMALFFSECESTCYLTDITASIYDKKPGPDLLTILRSFNNLSISHNLFSKAEKRQFGASGSAELNGQRRNYRGYGYKVQKRVPI